MTLLEHGIRLTFRTDPENKVLRNSVPVKSGWYEMGELSEILNQNGIFEDVWHPRFYLGEIIIHNRDNYKENETLSQWAFICPFKINNLKEQIENVKNKIKMGLL